MTRLIWIAALVAGCTADPPGGFGVNLTIRARSLPDAARRRIKYVQLSVAGEATPYQKELDVSAVINSGEARLRYIPGMRSGELRFTALALDEARAAVAAAPEQSVTVLATRSVAVTLTLVADIPDMAEPPKKLQGEACAASTECDTAGGCVDGYCCNDPCTATCTACNVAGREGVCSPVPAAAPPAHGSCGPDPVAGCQRDGTCDGAGACRLHPLGTVCRDSTCSAGMFTPDSTCDGSGTCRNANPTVCDPYVCKDARVCFDSCSDNTACKAPNTCDGQMSCGTKPDGATCTSATQCTSTFCVDGVCCNSACTGTCKTCKLVTAGVCSNVPDGQDPDGDCPPGAGSNAVCSPGLCNGTASCRVANAGTPCAASCPGNAPSNTVCDAAGACTNNTTGSVCTFCKICSVSGLSASCINKPDGTVCANASCSNNTGTTKSVCASGACPAPGTVSCGNYKCYLNFNNDAACYTNCGCCSMICVCGSRPENCATGRTCNASYVCQ